MGREDLWIPFEPGTDSLGTFILSTLAISEKIENQIVPYGRWVVLNNNDLFEVKLGVGIENPLFIIFKWKEGNPKLPGWNLNENLPQKIERQNSNPAVSNNPKRLFSFTNKFFLNNSK